MSPRTGDRFQPDPSPVADPKGTVGTSSRGRAANAQLLAVVRRGLGEAVDPPPPRQAPQLVLAGVLELEIRAFEEADR
jgi:hypothetical protein